MVDQDVVAAVRRYLAALPSVGIHATRAVLFGSRARGPVESEESDIDLIVIAPEFDGPRTLALVRSLWRMTIAGDNRIEPIPCGEREWETDATRPILEVARREGVLISGNPEGAAS